MTLNQLRALLAIEAHGSVQAAAAALGSSRTTTSQLLNALEAHCGWKLLIRGPQGTRLTAVGEEVAVEARRLLALAASLEERLAERGAQAPVRIQLSTSMPKIAHALALQAVRQHLPNTPLEVEAFQEPDATYAEDVHLRLQFGPPPADGPFRTFLLGSVPVRLVATADYLAREGTPRCTEDLAAHPLLLWRMATGGGARLPKAGGGGWIPASPAISTTVAPLLRTLAAQGAGIALVPCPRVGLAPPWEVFETLLPDQIGCDVSLRAIIPEHLAGLPTTRQLIAVTRDLSQQYSAGQLTWRRER